MDPAKPFTKQEEAAVRKVIELAKMQARELESEFAYPPDMVKVNNEAIRLVKAMLPD